LQLFALPEFSKQFSVCVIDLNAEKIPLLARVYERSRDYLGWAKNSEGNGSPICEHITRKYLTNVDVVIGLDNQLSLVDCLVRKSHRSLRGFVIQMGTNPKYYNRSQGLVRESPVTLLSWGNREVTDYVREGLVPSNIVPIGSLMQALAIRANASNLMSLGTFDVCIVSQFRPRLVSGIDVSDSARAEAESMPALLSLISPILRRLSLSTIVALRAEKNLSAAIDAEQERECFEKYLSHSFSTTSAAHLFSSYSAVLSSKLTIGRNSGVLFESMGSSSRILFVNPTTWHLFDPPRDWPFGLSRPTESELEKSIRGLLKMSDLEYLNATEALANKYSAQGVETLQILLEVIREG